MFVGEEIEPWKRQGHPMAALQAALMRLFSLLLLSIVYISQTVFTSPPKVDYHGVKEAFTP